ncbi:carboxypeptidase-like regulatory domain-containing protein [Pedobacter nototheniae]|uniref:carboxypeptidase-like regulatory domain-containing protein n=1 Tax=Pedobacter nototheniae TaxID=2488994 RepID=UPI00292E6F44|nr:carboxypeptidase-like regulatory domain-containing protein [Pedobacter nototheniae]
MKEEKASINYKLFYQFCFVLVFCFVSPISVYSQKIVNGKVLDDETDLPIANVSVFINGSTRGTMTNEKGEFLLHYLSINKYTVAFSSIGYETQEVNVSVQPDRPILITIRLKRRTISLSEVTISLQNNSWKRWGKIFLATLIGTSSHAQNCNLLNKKAVRFNYDKDNNKLYAYNTEPLVIQNDGLGYIIHYNIEDFSIDFNNEYIFYQGFVRFIEMEGSSIKRKRWETARHLTYQYSMARFVRTLYKGQAIDDLYEVRSIEKRLNTEKIRVINLLRQSNTHKKDSIKYYQQVIKQEDSIKVLSAPLHPKNFISAINDGKRGIIGINILYVSLISVKNKILNRLATSKLTILPDRHIYIEQTGVVTASQDFVIGGYWSGFERIGDALPIDYILQQK